MLFEPYVRFHILFKLWVAASSNYGVFSVCKNLNVNLVFPTSVFGVGIFLIAPFPDRCLLAPF